MSNLHKNTLKSFSETCGAAPATAQLLPAPGLSPAACRAKLMAAHTNDKNGEEAPLISEDILEIIVQVGAAAPQGCPRAARRGP